MPIFLYYAIIILRGDADSSSDLDFRVDKGKVRGFGFGGLCNAFEDTFDKPVDVVTTASLDKSFLDAIQSEEVLLYDLKHQKV